MHNASTGHDGRAAHVQDFLGPQFATDADAEQTPYSDNAKPHSGQRSAAEAEELISFEEAARILGMGQRNLRKVIQRSRERIDGKWTNGPTIRFFQCHPKAAIKFRRKWLDDFVSAYTHDPDSPSLLPPEPPRRRKKEHDKVGFGSQGESTEPVLGFDSALYDL
jgi:hypothetical protein